MKKMLEVMKKYNINSKKRQKSISLNSLLSIIIKLKFAFIFSFPLHS